MPESHDVVEEEDGEEGDAAAEGSEEGEEDESERFMSDFTGPKSNRNHCRCEFMTLICSVSVENGGG